jgi:hypothetical protein
VLCFVFDYLKALYHLEGEAHYAALLALVLDVDGLVVVVDEYLGEHPAVVVEAFSPLWDGLVAYLAPARSCARPSFLRRLHATRTSTAYLGSGPIVKRYMLWWCT